MRKPERVGFDLCGCLVVFLRSARVFYVPSCFTTGFYLFFMVLDCNCGGVAACCRHVGI